MRAPVHFNSGGYGDNNVTKSPLPDVVNEKPVEYISEEKKCEGNRTDTPKGWGFPYKFKPDGNSLSELD